VAQVKVAPGAAITAGERLTADSLPGQARALQTQVIEGMRVTEGAPTIGVALETPVDGQKTIAVFVNLK
jgi:hypothetical protein